MHVREVIVQVLEQAGPMDRHALLVAVMTNEPFRPISMEHFDSCLDKLEDAKEIEIDAGANVKKITPPHKPVVTKTAKAS